MGLLILLLIFTHTPHKDTVRVRNWKHRTSRLKSTPGLIVSILYLQPSCTHNNTHTRQKNVLRHKDHLGGRTHSFPLGWSQVGSCHDSFFFFLLHCSSSSSNLGHLGLGRGIFSQNEGVICSICYFLFNLICSSQIPRMSAKVSSRIQLCTFWRRWKISLCAL